MRRLAGTLGVAVDAPRESGSVRAEGATTRESRRYQDRGDEAHLESRVRPSPKGKAATAVNLSGSGDRRVS